MKKRGLSKKLNINSILLQDPSKIKNYTYLTTNVILINYVDDFIYLYIKNYINYITTTLSNSKDVLLDIYLKDINIQDNLTLYTTYLPLNFSIKLLDDDSILVNCNVYNYIYKPKDLQICDFIILYDYLNIWVNSQPFGFLLYHLIIHYNILDYIILHNICLYSYKQDVDLVQIFSYEWLYNIINTLYNKQLSQGILDICILGIILRIQKFNTFINYSVVDIKTTPEFNISNIYNIIRLYNYIYTHTYNEVIFDITTIDSYIRTKYNCTNIIVEPDLIKKQNLKKLRLTGIRSTYAINTGDVVFLEKTGERLVQEASIDRSRHFIMSKFLVNFNNKSCEKKDTNEIITQANTKITTTEVITSKFCRKIQLQLNNLILDVLTTKDSKLPDIIDDTVDFTNIYMTPEQWSIYWSHAGTKNTGIKLVGRSAKRKSNKKIV